VQWENATITATIVLMPEKYFDDQFDDEEVLLVFRKHPIVMRKGLILGMLGPLVGVLPATFKPELGFGWFFGGMLIGTLLGLIIYFPSWMSWHFTVCVVTNQRFIQLTQKGFFHREVSDIGLNLIQSLNYSIKGFTETLFGFGTITIQTYMGNIDIHDVYRPAKIHKRIQNILREQGITPKQYDDDVEMKRDEEKSTQAS